MTDTGDKATQRWDPGDVCRSKELYSTGAPELRPRVGNAQGEHFKTYIYVLGRMDREGGEFGMIWRATTMDEDQDITRRYNPHSVAL